MFRGAIWLLLAILLAAHVNLLARVDNARRQLPRQQATNYLLPPQIAKIVAFDYDGLAADVLFLKGLVFYGSTVERTERPRVHRDEWLWLNDLLQVATTLDPYFQDPYYFGNAFLPWDGRMAAETNVLLDKGIRARDWDWLLPFYAGFNSFYFLDDNGRASEYFAEALRRPGASPMLASLASRLAYRANRTENAMRFLEEILSHTQDPSLRHEYETRLLALQGVRYLEVAVEAFRKKFGVAPTELRQLLERRIVDRLPRDPYGGNYYIAPDGSIKTTSDLRERTGMQWLHLPEGTK